MGVVYGARGPSGRPFTSNATSSAGLPVDALEVLRPMIEAGMELIERDEDGGPWRPSAALETAAPHEDAPGPVRAGHEGEDTISNQKEDPRIMLNDTTGTTKATAPTGRERFAVVSREDCTKYAWCEGHTVIDIDFEDDDTELVSHMAFYDVTTINAGTPDTVIGSPQILQASKAIHDDDGVFSVQASWSADGLTFANAEELRCYCAELRRAADELEQRIEVLFSLDEGSVKL